VRCLSALHPRLLLEIDVGERLAAVIAHDETGVSLLDGPRRREAAGHYEAAVMVTVAPVTDRNVMAVMLHPWSSSGPRL
jgi:hypothetical protein